MAAVRLLGVGFPYGTLAVNITGSLAMGLLVGLFVARGDPGQSWRLFLTTGLLGGYTTFSTFSLEAVALHERGETVTAGLYVLASVAVSIGGLVLAQSIARQFGPGA